MKRPIEKRSPSGVFDHLALALTTFGVGYIPGAPGTYGSAVGVAVWWAASPLILFYIPQGWRSAAVGVLLTAFCLVGIAAADRAIAFFGNADPSEAVVDEVMGQLITFAFVPFAVSWPVVLAGFLLFRLFDIWKPFPIDTMQDLEGGLGVCIDDIVAGVYAGICLAIGYAVYTAF